MAKEGTIRCSYCERSFESVYKPFIYRLKLVSEASPDKLYSTVCPAISQDHYFCEVVCLREWVNKKWPKS